MIALWRLAPLALLLMGLAVIAAAVLIVPWAVQAQDPEVTPTAGSTGSNPPAKPSNLQATSEHDAVALTWTASTDQTVTHYAVLRRNRDEDATGVFHVIEQNAGPETSYTDGTVSASTTYIYRVKAVSPTGVSEWSGYVKADTPAAPPTTPTPTPTDTPTPEPETVPADQAPSGLSAALVEGGGVTLSWSAPAEDAGSVTGYEVLRAVGEGELSTLAADTGSTTTTYTDATATDAGETYAYTVKAIRGSDRSQASGEAEVQLPHDPADLRPTGLTVSLVDNRVTLSWTAPAEEADSVTGYEVLRRRPMAGEGTLATLVADTESAATTYTDATANEAGVQYVYRVKALRGGDVSLWSNFARIELPSDYEAPQEDEPEPESTSDDEAPTGLSAALAEGGGVALSWSAPAEDAGSVTGYEVLRAVGDAEFSTLVSDTGSTDTTYTDATATDAGETYAYTVKAIRGADRSEASGQAEVQIPHDPVDLAPTGLTASVFTLTVVGEEPTPVVGLTWTSPAEDADSITGYEVLRAVGEGELATLVADTGSTTTTYTDATATQTGETYAYQVKAVRGSDRSQASGQARVQVPHASVDLAPSDLTAEAADGGGVDLSWTAPAEDTDSVTGYEVLRAVGEGDMATLVADTASTTTTYTDATATGAGETYAYRVKAIRGEARSQGSNRVALVPVEPPATPENLKPTNLTFEIREDGVTLAWDAPAADAGSVTGYRVVRRRPDQGEKEWLVWKWDTGSTETSYRDGYARTHGEFYMYRVRALRGDDYSKMSNRVDVRWPEATPETTEWAPSNLRVLVSGSVTIDEQGNLQTGDDTVQLTWDAPAEGVEWVRGYEVQRATCDGDFAALAADTGSTATAHADAEFEEGETYTYRVRARRPQGLSLWSGTQTLLIPGGTGESDCAVPFVALPSTVQDPQTGLTPATLENTLLGYDEAEGTGTLAPNELIFGEDGAFRVTSVNVWPGNPGLVLYLTAGTSAQDAALADRDFILEADETVLVVGETEFSFDDAVLSHSDTTGDNAEYTGVVIATWTEGQAGLVAGETVDFRLLLRNRPDEAQFTQHDTQLVKNTGQTKTTFSTALSSDTPKRAVAITTGADSYELSSIGIYFERIDNTVTAGSHLTVTLNAVASNGEPGAALCTLTDPSTFSTGVLAFDAPATCPELEAATSYFVVIERVTHTTDVIAVGTTVSNNEDTGGAAGWLIGDSGYRFASGSSTWGTFSDSLQIEVRGAVQAQDPTFVVKNTGQTSDGSAVKFISPAQPANPEVVHRRTVAQAFTTGTSAGGYRLGSISIDFDTIDDPSTAGAELAVSLNESYSLFDPPVPGKRLCTLSDPESFTGSGVHTFDAPSTCPKLAPGRDYFVLVTRDTGTKTQCLPVFDSQGTFLGSGCLSVPAPFDDTISLKATTASGEDAGGVEGWSISDRRLWKLHRRAIYDTRVFVDHGWKSVDSESHLIEISGAAVVVDEDDLLNKEFNTLNAAGNDYPLGIWSDGTTMWVADLVDAKIYAYDMATKARDEDEDFDTLDAAGNDNPTGLWSDGSTMWVADWVDGKIYAYDLRTKARVPREDFNGLFTVGDDVWSGPRPRGIWSDGETMWVADEGALIRIYAYDMVHKGRTGQGSKDFPSLIGRPGRLVLPGGIWADETTMFVADRAGRAVMAYWRHTKSPQPGRYIWAPNQIVSGIWSDGTTMWASRENRGTIHAHRLPVPQQRPPGDLVTLEHVTDTTAMVKVNIEQLVQYYGAIEPAVSVTLLGTRSSATMYVHPDGGYARFLLMGLRPETQYTLEVSYGISAKRKPDAGRKIFRTDYARLDGIETSGLTHNEATVTVSEEGAKVDPRCCFKFWPHSNSSEGGTERTYYLRHKPSDDTAWSDPVELRFSGPTGATADARLTGLDPGTAYDVEIGEHPTFMPPRATVASYSGTLTVGDEGSGSNLWGMDLSGFFGDPYGSISPDPTFEVGGTEREVTVLYAHPYGGPGFDQPALYLEFDISLMGVKTQRGSSSRSPWTGQSTTAPMDRTMVLAARGAGSGCWARAGPKTTWSRCNWISLPPPRPSGQAPRWRALSPRTPCRRRWPSRRR